MDFLKRAADALTHAEERAAQNAIKEERKETVVLTPAPATVVVTETTVPATSVAVVATGEAEVTTMKAATVDIVARAPVVEETIIQEKKESMSLPFTPLFLRISFTFILTFHLEHTNS